MSPRVPFRDYRRRHAAFLVAAFVVALTTFGVDGWLVSRREAYGQEIHRLRAGMSDAERKRSDAILASKEKQLQMMMVLVRRQAKWDKEIHLAVSVDSGRMYLEREGALLREIPVEVGPARRVGVPPDTLHLAVPRGTRAVQSVLTDSSGWEAPRWIYADRGIPAPADRGVQGGLGPVAIVLDGGTVIYSFPSQGPLNDSSYVLPGGIRARAEDLRAIVPNLTRGTTVYFY